MVAGFVVVKFVRFNLLVVVLQLAAFLVVQADFPTSQAIALRPPAMAGSCVEHCCCPMEKHEQGRCCCHSKGTPAKPGRFLRALCCGEDVPNGEAPVVVKFQVALPVLTAVRMHDSALTPVFAALIDAPTQAAEPPDPPPRLLIPA